MMSFKEGMLASNKRLTDLQSTQFNDFKNSLNHVSYLISELKVKNSDELRALRGKMVVLENKHLQYCHMKLFCKSCMKHLNANDSSVTRLLMV